MRKSLPMTGGRVAALLLAVPVALLVIAWTALTEVAFAGQASYPVQLDLPIHGKAVTVGVDSGNMTVTGAAGHRLRLTGTAHYSLVRSTVTWRSGRSGVTVSSRCHFVTGECSFVYHVALPAGTRALLSNSSGDLTLRGLAGHVDAASGSGNITAQALSGTVSFRDGSGDISATGLRSTDVTVADHSGNIVLAFSAVPSQVHISDGSGNVTLVLPRGSTSYHVIASSSSGQKTVAVPVSSASAHLIEVTDSSGDISITN